MELQQSIRGTLQQLGPTRLLEALALPVGPENDAARQEGLQVGAHRVSWQSLETVLMQLPPCCSCCCPARWSCIMGCAWATTQSAHDGSFSSEIARAAQFCAVYGLCLCDPGDEEPDVECLFFSSS